MSAWGWDVMELGNEALPAASSQPLVSCRLPQPGEGVFLRQPLDASLLVALGKPEAAESRPGKKNRQCPALVRQLLFHTGLSVRCGDPHVVALRKRERWG